MMQQRRDEILAKKAKLAELKRQRELRGQATATRQSVGSSSDVRPALPMHNSELTGDCS
jgi:dynein intermediate chain